MMSTDEYRASLKSRRSPQLTTPAVGSDSLQTAVPLNPPPYQSYPKPIIKDLRHVNLLDEIYPLQDEKTHIQETVEIIPKPISCERIFYSYTNDHTELRLREGIQLDRSIIVHSNDLTDENDNFINLYHDIRYDQRFQVENYSTTLFIFPKQRNEKFITEFRYIPEHITIKYKSSLELLTTSLNSFPEHYYQNIPDFFHIASDVFYRI